VRKYGVLIISHGSRDNRWVELVDQATAEINLTGEMPIRAVFLEIVTGRLIQDGINALQAQGVTDIIAVPLFVSSGSTHVDEISYALGATSKPLSPTDLEKFSLAARIHFATPLDDDADIAQVIFSKIKPLSQNPSREIIIIVGHGSKEKEFHLRWRRGLSLLAMRVKQLGNFAGADAAMLAPKQLRNKVIWWRKHMPDHHVIVAPFFLSDGYFVNEVIPAILQGLNVKYNGMALLPHPLISHWMEKQINRITSRMGD